MEEQKRIKGAGSGQPPVHYQEDLVCFIYCSLFCVFVKIIERRVREGVGEREW